jgi:hypothetical protein
VHRDGLCGRCVTVWCRICFQRVDNEYSLPTTQEVYDFARELFLKAQVVVAAACATFAVSECVCCVCSLVQSASLCPWCTWSG